MYGQKDLRLESFELPKIQDDEILASVVTDSLCMSSWKAANQGGNHKKVPDNVGENPILLGHEFCGEIIEVGEKWKGRYKEGEKYVVQANLQLSDRPDCPGYSFPYTGGDATYIILAREVMEQDCLLEYNGETFFEGSLIEPLSCVIGAFKANYHLKEGTYDHQMGIKSEGNLIIMGGTGPMGYLAIDYALHGPVQPKKLVVTGRTQEKVDLLEKLYPKEEGKEVGVEITYVNTGGEEDSVFYLNQLVEGNGYDDVFVFAPVQELVEEGSALLAADGCFNFFAGPQNTDFEAKINFYDIHYKFTHYVGTSGGNTEDMRDAVRLIEEKKVNVQKIVSHVLGLNDAKETTLNLPDIPGGKKLIYTHKSMSIKSLDDILKDTNNPLQEILEKHDGIWSKEAEDFILANQEEIQIP
jgi:L-sorbose 1-phosphate reductase